VWTRNQESDIGETYESFRPEWRFQVLAFTTPARSLEAVYTWEKSNLDPYIESASTQRSAQFPEVTCKERRKNVSLDLRKSWKTQDRSRFISLFADDAKMQLQNECKEADKLSSYAGKPGAEDLWDELFAVNILAGGVWARWGQFSTVYCDDEKSVVPFHVFQMPDANEELAKWRGVDLMSAIVVDENEGNIKQWAMIWKINDAAAPIRRSEEQNFTCSGRSPPAQATSSLQLI